MKVDVFKFSCKLVLLFKIKMFIYKELYLEMGLKYQIVN